jgi:DNA-binding transcriptional regulator YhcF (GntR family)
MQLVSQIFRSFAASSLDRGDELPELRQLKFAKSATVKSLQPLSMSEARARFFPSSVSKV